MAQGRRSVYFRSITVKFPVYLFVCAIHECVSIGEYQYLLNFLCTYTALAQARMGAYVSVYMCVYTRYIT
jgi:hypothetical protein